MACWVSLWGHCCHCFLDTAWARVGVGGRGRGIWVGPEGGRRQTKESFELLSQVASQVGSVIIHQSNGICSLWQIKPCCSLVHGWPPTFLHSCMHAAAELEGIQRRLQDPPVTPLIAPTVRRAGLANFRSHPSCKEQEDR